MEVVAKRWLACRDVLSSCVLFGDIKLRKFSVRYYQFLTKGPHFTYVCCSHAGNNSLLPVFQGHKIRFYSAGRIVRNECQIMFSFVRFFFIHEDLDGGNVLLCNI